MKDSINSKQLKKEFTTIETIILVFISLLIGLSIGFLISKNTVNDSGIKGNDKELKEFVKQYNYILDNYYEEIDEKKLINSAIAGMMESLDDPHSVYMDESEIDNFNISLNGSYKGIGVQILKDEETGYMLIVSVFKDSPAAKSGLLPGDMIVSVDGVLCEKMTASEFSSTIRKEDKDSYTFKIIRNSETLEISLDKTIVNLKSVVSNMYVEDSKKIGYIYIGIFANNTYIQFKEELEKLESQNIDYLILDVRGNTGGHLTAVDKILDLFINKNQIMYKFEKNKKTTEIYGTGDENKQYKIILLGDELSASASEVLISSLKENLGSIFIGKKTYGKGTVQELITLSDGTQYKITVKKWLTPKGNWINDSKGILPDIEVDLSEKYYETYDENDDNQLQRAIQYIKENKDAL